MKNIDEIKKIQVLFDTSINAICITDIDGKFTYVNQSFVNMFGYNNKSELLEMSLADLYDKGKTQQAINILNKDGCYTTELEGYKKDGTKIIVQFNCNIIFKNNNIPIGIYIILNDITNHKKIEKAFEESEKRFMDLLYSSNDAILIIDQETFVDCNHATVKMLKYKNKDKLLMTHPSKLSPPLQPDGRESFEKAEEMMKIALTKGYNRFEWIHRKADGTDFPVEVSLTPVTLKGKTVIHCLWRDLTKQKEINRMFIQSQKMEAAGTLAGGMAHEFNNILGIIMGYAELLKNSKKNTPELEKGLSEIYKQGEKAAAIIKNVLKFSRKDNADFEIIDLRYLLEDTIKMIKLLLPSNIELSSNIEKHLPMIKGNFAQIQQALINICNNSIHAIGEKKGVLKINLQMDNTSTDSEKYIKLSISDNGSGIKDNVMNQIFDPFFTTKKTGEGTGLGLSVVHGIIDNHNGKIEAKSKSNSETIFNIYFPFVSTKVLKKINNVYQTPQNGTEHILIVDDEKSLSEILKKSLMKFGYKVSISVNPIEALKKVKKAPDKFDLIISDYAMPEITGIELYNKLNKIRINIPFILVTGYIDINLKTELKDKSNTKILYKPLNINALTTEIRNFFD